MQEETKNHRCAQIRLFSLILISLFATTSLKGQSDIKRFFNLADNFATTTYTKVDYDTLYISRPKEKFMIKLQSSLSSYINRERVNSEYEYYKAEFQTDKNFQIRTSIVYSGFSIGFSITPETIFGHRKYKEYELGFKFYNNRYVIDFDYYKSSTLKGLIKSDDLVFRLVKGDVRIKLFNVSMYYIFNNKKCSFPAAFTQTYIQKKSAGSVIAGFSFQGGTLKTQNISSFLGLDIKFKMRYLGVGVGYGYNLVFSEGNWLIHASLLPTYVLFNKSSQRSEEEFEKSKDKGLLFIFNSRLAIVKHFNHKFRLFGAQTLLGVSWESNNLERFKRSDSFTQNKWNANFFIGFKF